MAWFPFKFKKSPKSFLGIDIGTSSIRVVELGKKSSKRQLENYGEIATSPIQKTILTTNRGSFYLSNQEVASAISAVLKEAGIETKEVNFPIPDFFSFFTSFDLPQMSEKELEQAVKYEARGYIPLPLSEVTLDWQVVDKAGFQDKTSPLKILVVAIPNEIINQYQQISFLAKLELRSLEAEVFALQRSLSQSSEKPAAVVDVGARSTTCNIFEKETLKTSHSFNVSGNELTEILSRSLKIDYQEAEKLKKEHGLLGFGQEGKDVKEILSPLIESILAETKKTFQAFLVQEGKNVQELFLAGGSALMPGLKDYFAKELGQVKVEILNPFADISYPVLLTDTLKEMGPAWVIAVGSALRGLE